MKLAKQKPTDLERVLKVLEDCRVLYVKASVDATDISQNKTVPTEVVLVSAVFHRTTGKWLFAGPTMQPSLPGPNHKLS